MSPLETSSGEGLVVTYDEDTLSITFDWDPETHPEYNFLESMSPQDLTKMLTDYLELTDAELKEFKDEIQDGGQSS